jgi:hypothetical protein
MALEHLVMVCSEHFTTARDDCQACQNSKAFSNMQDEIAALKAENAKLREALKKTYRIADSWIQDQLQGTKFYTEENEALEPVRKLLGIE